GHFAFFSEQVFLNNYKMATLFLFYILFFLLGAFVSSLIMEWISRYKSQLAIVIPVFIEIGILLYISFADSLFPNQQLPDVQFACMLLFAMGLQNALVTRVSQSIVRTTHLTGLF